MSGQSGPGNDRFRPKRVLVTGLGTFWGGLVARALEEDPNIEVIVGLDTTEPTSSAPSTCAWMPTTPSSPGS